MSTKKIVCVCLMAIAVTIFAVFYYERKVSRTKIGFLNYQTLTLGHISQANDNSMIKIEEIEPENLYKSSKYDMIFVNGMGLRITEEQRNALVKAAEKGTPVITTSATNPMNEIISVDSIDNEYLKQYLLGGRTNYLNMLRYVRKFIDGKKYFIDEPGDPLVTGASLLYYPSGGENKVFNSVKEYEEWLKETGKWKESVPRIILTGQMGEPESIIAELEKTDNIVYAVSVPQIFIAHGHADSIAASAMIYMAHGRMGDNVVTWLEKNNIPLFAPINANNDYEKWMADKMGMNGGFLSQSVVTPEIDGAIRPFTLFAQFHDADGLPIVEAIPGRLEEFITTVNNHIKLRETPNSEKKIAIFYFKGPGQSSLVAEGMDVVPSLFNLLVKLKAEGYRIDYMPESATALEKLIAERGKIFNGYAKGAKKEYLKTGTPEIISWDKYENWANRCLAPGMLDQIDAIDGRFPGHALSDSAGNIALARIELGNIVLIPQPAAGFGDDDFAIVHGTDMAPPHDYVAAYLWAREGFGADALIHFGAHGSLEFTPRKQVALGSEDWSDRLIGSLPHIYIYSTSNVGEAMTAKRRSYATLVNYLTPPFRESNVRGIYKNLTDAIMAYNKSANHNDSIKAAIEVKRYALELGLHRDLRFDSIAPFSDSEIHKLESFAEEIINERITGPYYVMGKTYTDKDVVSTLEAMTVDPLAYCLQKLKGGDISIYREQAKKLVNSGKEITDEVMLSITGLQKIELDSARRIITELEGSRDMLSKMMVLGAMMPNDEAVALKIADRPEIHRPRGLIPGMSPEKALELARKMGASEDQLKKMQSAMNRNNVMASAISTMSQEKDSSNNSTTLGRSASEIEFATAVNEIERTLWNIGKYRKSLQESPELEMLSVMNALNGGYVSPTSGGDPVLNPAILPTGRNMYAVNAEETPTAMAWEKGKELDRNTLEMYKKSHGDSLPAKVSYTLWSSEFIETEGATIAQILYMLGVEPVRDPFGRVTDLRVIPSEELGRPRIDVVVQTSGQLRDLASSRLFLIGRAVKMAAESVDDKYPNFVADGVVKSEKYLVDKGLSPKEARELSVQRVFGGINGNYGTGIQDMIEAGDRWEDENEIARVYLNNMGALYGSEENWEKMRNFVFEAALINADAVVQPRQSNTWGALSLDHVYEFMGGLNLAVKNVTGKEPEAYFSDYRNRNKVRMQELKEAVGVESRTTILNPTYIKAKMEGGAGDAASIADVIRNTYGWNVMKADIIDDELWEAIYNTYVADINDMGIKDFFRNVNPAALQELTAVMLETIRKGMWNANDEQISEIARLHVETVEDFGAACTGFVCDNSKLKDFIASNVEGESGSRYKTEISRAREENIVEVNEEISMKRERLSGNEAEVNTVSGVTVAIIVVLAVIGIVYFIRKRRS